MSNNRGSTVWARECQSGGGATKAEVCAVAVRWTLRRPAGRATATGTAPWSGRPPLLLWGPLLNLLVLALEQLLPWLLLLLP
ncbi:unnamed protein product [Closterium sp. NIES-53]